MLQNPSCEQRWFPILGLPFWALDFPAGTQTRELLEGQRRLDLVVAAHLIEDRQAFRTDQKRRIVGRKRLATGKKASWVGVSKLAAAGWHRPSRCRRRSLKGFDGRAEAGCDAHDVFSLMEQSCDRRGTKHMV